MDELKKDIYRIKRQIEILRMQKENLENKLLRLPMFSGHIRKKIQETTKEINHLYDQL